MEARSKFREMVKSRAGALCLMGVNILGMIFFLITVMGGRSRYIVTHDLRAHMSEYDVEVVVQRGREAFPYERPLMISDTGPQFISKDFKDFIRDSGFTMSEQGHIIPRATGNLRDFTEK